MNKSIRDIINSKKIIGVGSRRVVYDLEDGFVLKVAKSKYGRWSNKREVMIYRSSPNKIKNHLANITTHGNQYDWLIMKRYHLNFQKNGINMLELFRMKAKFKKYGIIPFEVTRNNGKPNYQNIRLKPNGEIIVIDYGNFKYWY
ncbi:hypothetical protein P4H61_13385 [Paenibacillus peoriae]|uniref:hypothetical protein n=1 Tax=Paenibacillus peoriae TaxID=59893 RepID=UPI00026C64E8|nr:hypothetical protein [Paenibacillus peoriae]MEC0182476.1 hypothetical protein [Paenibacillus peoriae]